MSVTLAIDPAALTLSEEDVAVGATNIRALLQDPRYLPWDRWTATVVADNSVVPLPLPEDQWRLWADRVTQVFPEAPRPQGFPHWRPWAFAWLASQ